MSESTQKAIAGWLVVVLVLGAIVLAAIGEVYRERACTVAGVRATFAPDGGGRAQCRIENHSSGAVVVTVARQLDDDEWRDVATAFLDPGGAWEGSVLMGPRPVWEVRVSGEAIPLAVGETE